jgi:hypothetical protein
MAFRDDLKANLDVALSGTNVSVSAELPFTSSGEALHMKNMKKVYLDEDNILREPLVESLDFDPVENIVRTVTGYLVIDAKNPISDIDVITDRIINSKNAVSNQISRDCEMTTSFEGDKLVFQFDFEFTTI